MIACKKIGNILSTAVVAVVVVLAVSLVGVRLVGMDVYTVLSGSMEPTYSTGSVIWVKSCEPEDVEVGDPITFVLDENLTVATHRVVAIDEAEGEFTTKGDANDQVDGAPVLFENLIGRPVFSVPGLGYFVAYVQSPPGCYIALAAGAVILMLMFLPAIFAKDEEGEGDEVSRKAKERKAARKGGGRAGGHGGHARAPHGSDAGAYSRAAYGSGAHVRYPAGVNPPAPQMQRPHGAHASGMRPVTVGSRPARAQRPAPINLPDPMDASNR